MKKSLYYVYRKDPQGVRDYVVIVYTDYSTRVVYQGEQGYTAAKARAMSSRRVRGVRPSH